MDALDLSVVSHVTAILPALDGAGRPPAASTFDTELREAPAACAESAAGGKAAFSFEAVPPVADEDWQYRDAILSKDAAEAGEAGLRLCVIESRRRTTTATTYWILLGKFYEQCVEGKVPGINGARYCAIVERSSAHLKNARTVWKHVQTTHAGRMPREWEGLSQNEVLKRVKASASTNGDAEAPEGDVKRELGVRKPTVQLLEFMRKANTTPQQLIRDALLLELQGFTGSPQDARSTLLKLVEEVLTVHSGADAPYNGSQVPAPTTRPTLVPPFEPRVVKPAPMSSSAPHANPPVDVRPERTSVSAMEGTHYLERLPFAEALTDITDLPLDAPTFESIKGAVIHDVQRPIMVVHRESWVAEHAAKLFMNRWFAARAESDDHPSFILETLVWRELATETPKKLRDGLKAVRDATGSSNMVFLVVNVDAAKPAAQLGIRELVVEHGRTAPMILCAASKELDPALMHSCRVIEVGTLEGTELAEWFHERVRAWGVSHGDVADVLADADGNIEVSRATLRERAHQAVDRAGTRLL